MLVSITRIKLDTKGFSLVGKQTYHHHYYSQVSEDALLVLSIGLGSCKAKISIKNQCRATLIP